MHIQATTTTSHETKEHTNCKFQSWVNNRYTTGTSQEIIDAFIEQANVSKFVIMTKQGELVATDQPLYTAGDLTVTQIKVDDKIIFALNRK